jgi:putative membrane protein
LNSSSAILLFFGWWNIKVKRNEKLHAKLMCSAFLTSTLFLISYLYFHSTGNPKTLQNDTAWKTLYLIMLFSHIGLAIIMVPMILRTFYLAINKRFSEHIKLGKITLAIWFYVSVTGVMIYLILYQLGW